MGDATKTLQVVTKVAIRSNGCLRISDTGTPASRKLGWAWKHGPETVGSTFATFVAGADYALCVYDGTGLVDRIDVPAGADSWSQTPKGDPRYADRDATPDGVTKVIFQVRQGRQDERQVDRTRREPPGGRPTDREPACARGLHQRRRPLLRRSLLFEAQKHEQGVRRHERLDQQRVPRLCREERRPPALARRPADERGYGRGLCGESLGTERGRRRRWEQSINLASRRVVSAGGTYAQRRRCCALNRSNRRSRNRARCGAPRDRLRRARSRLQWPFSEVT